MRAKDVPRAKKTTDIKKTALKEKKPRAPKPPKEVELRVPDKVEGIDRWLILGLDPSLSNTGYAFMEVNVASDKLSSSCCDAEYENLPAVRSSKCLKCGGICVPLQSTPDRSTARFLEVGSVKPENSSDPVWVRSKLVATALRDKLTAVCTGKFGEGWSARNTGLIISFEAPTPQNDFLTTISRILHLVLLADESWAHSFARVHVQLTNASTLRRLMGLTKTGSKNKVENQARAWQFLDQGTYPNLDTDACDAVLMGMMARYAAAILMGFPQQVPDIFLTALCNAEKEVVGKGTNTKTRTKGLFYRPEYWTRYERAEYAVCWRNAKQKKARLDRSTYTV